MISFFQFQGPYDSELSADFQEEFRQWERFPCPVNPNHDAVRRRTGPLHHFMKHNDRNQQIIWGLQVAVHKNAIEKLEHQGFTGFRTNPAQVTFRDGVTSNDYLEFIVTGWAGVAPPECGVRVVEKLPRMQMEEVQRDYRLRKCS